MTAALPISDGQAAYCEAIGVELVELPVAVTAIAAITEELNPLDCVEFADLPEPPEFSVDWYESEDQARARAEAQARATELGSASIFPALSDFDAIAEEVSATGFSFDWVDYPSTASAEGVKVLEVDSGEGCTAPTPEAISSGRYPLSRTIYLYVDKVRAAAQPHVSAFVDFYLTDHGLETAVGEIGYLSLTEEAKAATRAAWANR